MKTLRALIWAKQWQAVQATIDTMLALHLLNDSPAEVQYYARGERLHGTLGGGSHDRDLLVHAVLAKLGREPMALPHTPGQEPARVLVATPKEAEAPHSRACWPHAHEHGYDCHPTCPTCRGGRR